MNASHSHSSTSSLRPVLALLVFAGWLAGSFAVAEEPNATWEAGQLTSRTRVTDLVMDSSGRSVFVRYTSRDGKSPTELIDVFTGKEIGAVKPGEGSQRSRGFFGTDGGTLVLVTWKAAGKGEKLVQGWDARRGKALGEPINFSD